MQRYKLDFNTQPVLDFFKSLVPGYSAPADVAAIGLRRDDRLIAAALYDGFNGSNMWVHLAGETGSKWLVRDFLHAGFAYPFEVCGVQRLSAYVNADNWRARRFNEHVGFKPEAVLRGAAPGGGDVLIYVMWKKDCRYVSLAQNRV